MNGGAQNFAGKAGRVRRLILAPHLRFEDFLKTFFKNIFSNTFELFFELGLQLFRVSTSSSFSVKSLRKQHGGVSLWSERGFRLF